MPQDDHPDNDSSEANKENGSTSHAGLRWIVIAGCILFLALLFLSIFLPNLSERVKFFTVNALSLLVLAVIVVQTYIYRRQWDAMRTQANYMKDQLDAMKESLVETRNIVSQNERAVAASEAQAKASELSAKAAERSVEISQQAHAASERAYIGIREIKMEKFSVGQIPTLYITWYNGGKTPATRFRAVPYLVVGDKPEERNYILDDDWSDSKVNFLPTGMPQTMPYPQTEIGFNPVTKDMIATLENGSKHLYLMVSALYVDFMEQTQHFEASYIYDYWERMFVEL